MLVIILRSLVIYLLVLVVFRLMGKRQIGQMQPFELVLTLIIADLATIPMAEISVPVLHGIVPLLTLVVIHFILTLLTRMSNKFGKFISGKPVIIINPDGIDYKAMQKLAITVDDIFEAIRGCNYFKLDQIEYAIMETTGKVSVLPKSDFAPATVEDLKLSVDQSTLPITVVSEGSFMEDNAKLANVDKEFIEKVIVKNGIKRIKDVLVMTIDDLGEVYLQGKNGIAQQIKTEHIGKNRI